MAKNIVIYASKSKLCYTLLNAMNSCGILGFFQLIDVCDPRIKIPREVTNSVPTLIISNIKKPLVGDEAFIWVENTRKWKEQNNKLKQMVKNNVYQWNMLSTNQNVSDKKLAGYVGSEMNGFSDKFCILDNNGALPQNFVSPFEDIKIYTANEEHKINKLEQDKRLNEKMKQREEQDIHHKTNNMNIIEQAKRGQLIPSQLPSTEQLN